MPLWLTSTSAASRPKFLPDDTNATGSGGSREEAYATTGGWALRPGKANSGNDNTSATPEVLVAIRNLSSTMGEANVLSVDWDATTTLTHAGAGTFDMVFTCDEAITVTSAANSGDNTDTNHWYFNLDVLGPTDMVSDTGMVMQYYSGSGTNTITFRGTVPAAAVASGKLAFNATGSTSKDCEMITNGSAAAVDGNGTTCTWADQKLFGSSAAAGVDHSTAIFGSAVAKTGGSTYTLETVCGSSSGSSATVLVGVTIAA